MLSLPLTLSNFVSLVINVVLATENKLKVELYTPCPCVGRIFLILKCTMILPERGWTFFRKNITFCLKFVLTTLSVGSGVQRYFLTDLDFTNILRFFFQSDQYILDQYFEIFTNGPILLRPIF